MLVPVLLFIVGLVLLIFGGDWFVDGATGIAHQFHVPELIIGATIVSIGTTLPEVMVSATSAISGHGEIAYGNAIGSVICNTALIAALTITIRPGKIDNKTLKIPVLFFFGAAVFYLINSYIFQSFSRLSGLILIAGFVAYMITSIVLNKKNPGSIPMEEAEESETPSKELPLWKNLILLIIGAAFITYGADLLVDNGTLIAQGLGVPESVIALTFVALGTSLPELVTAITSLIKGHGSLSLGNVIGANLFNLVLVSGVAITLNPFTLPQSRMIGNVVSSLVVDLPVMMFVMMFLTIPALIRSRLSRVQGIVLLLVYAGFCAYQFIG